MKTGRATKRTKVQSTQGKSLSWLVASALRSEAPEDLVVTQATLEQAFKRSYRESVGSMNRSLLVADALSSLAFADRTKSCFFVEDPYSEILAITEGLKEEVRRNLYEKLHSSICNSRRVVAGTVATRVALQMRHSQYVGYLSLPPLKWEVKATPSFHSIVVVSPASAAGLRIATRLATDIATHRPDVDVKVALVGPELTESLRRAMEGTGGLESVVNATLHVYVGHGSTDCTQLRLSESWLNGVPVLQVLPATLAPPVVSPLTYVEHGSSGLLARSREEVLEHVDSVIDNPEYAELLANRAKSSLMRAAPTWSDMCAELAL